CSYYDRFWNQFIETTNTQKTLIEIGGFPGRYLAYLANKYQIKPVCLDYNSDKAQIEGVFEVMDIKDYEIIQSDFTTYRPEALYDYVMSNGFIEHFEDFNTILDAHIHY